MRNMVTLGVFEERRGGRGVEFLVGSTSVVTEHSVRSTPYSVPSSEYLLLTNKSAQAAKTGANSVNFYKRPEVNAIARN